MINRASIPNYLREGGLNKDAMDDDDLEELYNDRFSTKEGENEDIDPFLAYHSKTKQVPEHIQEERKKAPSPLMEDLYKQLDTAYSKSDKNTSTWKDLGYDIARLIAPDEKSIKFADALQARDNAPAIRAKEKLLKQIELAKTIDESRRKAYEFELNYEQKDRAIGAKHASGQNQALPIDPRTGEAFETKDAYKEYLRLKNRIALEDVKTETKDNESHKKSLAALIKSRDSASRILSSLPKIEKHIGGGKMGALGLGVRSYFDSDLASLEKDLGELAASEEVSDLGARSSKAALELYQNIKPGVGEPLHIFKHKLELRKTLAGLQLAYPERVEELISEGRSRNEAKRIADAEISAQITNLSKSLEGVDRTQSIRAKKSEKSVENTREDKLRLAQELLRKARHG